MSDKLLVNILGASISADGGWAIAAAVVIIVVIVPNHQFRFRQLGFGAKGLIAIFAAIIIIALVVAPWLCR